MLYVDIPLPDDWSYEKKKRAYNEADFQFYHVAQTLFETIRRRERLGRIQLEKLFCYAGADGVEGLSRKLCIALREDFQEYLTDYRELVTTFRTQLGSTGFFPLTILRRSNAFRTLTGFSRVHLKRRRHIMEGKIFASVRRIVNHERIFFTVEGSAQESLQVSQTVEEGLNDVQELFSFQLGISSTFFEVIGLTLAVLGFIMVPGWLLIAPMGVAVAVILLAELVLLLKYSTGEVIVEQLNVLDSTLQLY